MRFNWETKLDPYLGFCYFYDPKEKVHKELTVLQSDPWGQTSLLAMDIKFDVKAFYK